MDQQQAPGEAWILLICWEMDTLGVVWTPPHLDPAHPALSHPKNPHQVHYPWRQQAREQQEHCQPWELRREGHGEQFLPWNYHPAPLCLPTFLPHPWMLTGGNSPSLEVLKEWGLEQPGATHGRGLELEEL